MILLTFHCIAAADKLRSSSNANGNNGDSKRELAALKDGPAVQIAAQTFTFRELAAATKNFRPQSFLGEGGFGRVYKGRLETTGQVIFLSVLLILCPPCYIHYLGHLSLLTNSSLLFLYLYRLWLLNS